jgi:NAD(P)-dependent dehydrogenase (short-subunit alcohol dehydrogenase family)
VGKALEGKVVLVTGGASGIGAATAVRLTEQGAQVYALDVQDGIRAAPSGVRSVHCDVTQEEQVARAVELALGEEGRVDVLVNAAGVVTKGDRIEDTDVSEWRRVIEVNLTGPYLCIKHVVPAMRSQGSGAIVNIASSSALQPSQLGTAAYTASKGGLVALTRQLVLELSPYGIRVNAIAPGPVATPLVAHHGDAWRRAKARVIPIGDIGEPEDIADAVLFLASESARYVTGHVLSVDGGMTAVVVTGE